MSPSTGPKGAGGDDEKQQESEKMIQQDTPIAKTGSV